MVAICIGVAETLAWLSYGEATKQTTANASPLRTPRSRSHAGANMARDPPRDALGQLNRVAKCQLSEE